MARYMRTEPLMRKTGCTRTDIPKGAAMLSTSRQNNRVERSSRVNVHKGGNMKPYNQNIKRVIELSRQLMFLADKGDLQRMDSGCGVLFGVVRDCAYKMREEAEVEKQKHIRRGDWDDEDD